MNRLRAGGGRGGTGFSPIGAALDLWFARDLYATYGMRLTLAEATTFTRASVADWVNATSDGFETQAASGVLRRSSRGALIEESRTNLFLNSFSPATQTITVVNGTTYTVSRGWGAGTVTLSGALTGTPTNGTPVTGAASSTSLTVTVSGSVGYVNVEAAGGALSPISTAGVSATRAADVLSATSPPVLTDGTIVFIGRTPPAGAGIGVCVRYGPAVSSGLRLLSDNAGALNFGETGQTTAGGTWTTPNGPNLRFCAAGKWTGTSRALSVNGAAIQSGVAASAIATPSFMSFGANGDGTLALNRFVERVIVFPTAVDDATLQTYSNLITWGG